MTDNHVTLHDYAKAKIQNLLYNINHVEQKIQRHGDDIQIYGDGLQLEIPVRKIWGEEKIISATVVEWNASILVWQAKAIAWKLVIFLSEPTDTSIEKGKNFVQSIQPLISALYHTELGNRGGIIPFLSDWPQRDINIISSLTSLRQMLNGYSDQSSSNDEEKVVPPGVRF